MKQEEEIVMSRSHGRCVSEIQKTLVDVYKMVVNVKDLACDTAFDMRKLRDLNKYDTMDEYNVHEPIVMTKFKMYFPHLAHYAHYETAEETLFDTVGTIDMVLSEIKSMMLEHDIRIVERPLNVS